jgi:uncharacterized membrane protein
VKHGTHVEREQSAAVEIGNKARDVAGVLRDTGGRRVEPAHDLFDENIRAIVKLEEAALATRSPIECLSSAVVRFLGSSWFLALHVLWFTAWMFAGLGLLPGIPSFDPFPFSLLTMVVSLEAIVLSIFILISQNQMSRHADRRAHLDLQVDVLAEQEVTTILRMVKEIREQLGTPQVRRPEVDGQLEKIDVQRLANQLEAKLPAQP